MGSNHMNDSEKMVWVGALNAHLAAAKLKRVDLGDIVDAANWATGVVETLKRAVSRGGEMLSRGMLSKALESAKCALAESGTVVQVDGRVVAASTATPGEPASEQEETFDPNEVSTQLTECDNTWSFIVLIGNRVTYSHGGYETKAEAQADMDRFRKMAEQFAFKRTAKTIEAERKRLAAKQAEEARKPAPPTPTVKISGPRLAYARKMAEISVPVAAKYLSLPAQTVVVQEIGTPEVTLPYLKQLCDLYGVSTDFLTDLEPATIKAYQADKRTSRR